MERECFCTACGTFFYQELFYLHPETRRLHKGKTKRCINKKCLYNLKENKGRSILLVDTPAFKLFHQQNRLFVEHHRHKKRETEGS